MTRLRAYEIAKKHMKYEPYSISWYELADGKHLRIQTVSEQGYYDDTNYVTCIDLEEENGDACECHTTKPDDIDDITHWIYWMCWNLEEKGVVPCE